MISSVDVRDHPGMGAGTVYFLQDHEAIEKDVDQYAKEVL